MIRAELRRELVWLHASVSAENPEDRIVEEEWLPVGIDRDAALGQGVFEDRELPLLGGQALVAPAAQHPLNLSAAEWTLGGREASHDPAECRQATPASRGAAT